MYGVARKLPLRFVHEPPTKDDSLLPIWDVFDAAWTANPAAPANLDEPDDGPNPLAIEDGRVDDGENIESEATTEPDDEPKEEVVEVEDSQHEHFEDSQVTCYELAHGVRSPNVESTQLYQEYSPSLPEGDAASQAFEAKQVGLPDSASPMPPPKAAESSKARRQRELEEKLEAVRLGELQMVFC